tara:strand:- start:207 stop:500 length:294 start_codon:yes stop_codon:yes gene_type:complete
MGKLKQLAEAAAEFYQVPFKKLISANRSAIYTRPRHHCQWVAADAGLKKSVIAKFWKQDRTAVYYGCKVVSARIEKNEFEKNELQRFMKHARKFITR